MPRRPGRSRPSRAGALFVGSQNGTVYALEAKTGCVHWTFTAKAGVRTALPFGRASREARCYFGDTGANVYALDAETGRQLWSRRLDEHPYARITGIADALSGRLYVPVSSLEETAASQQGYECCTFRGSLDRARRARPARSSGDASPSRRRRPLGKNAAGVDAVGPVRRRHLVGADDRHETRRWSTRAPATPTARRSSRPPMRSSRSIWRPARSSGSKQMTAGDVFGCRPGSANCGEKAGPDFDFGTPPMLTTMADGNDIIVVGQKSGNDVRTRSGQAGRGAVGISRRARIDLGRHPVGRRGRSASRRTSPSPTFGRRSRAACTR